MMESLKVVFDIVTSNVTKNPDLIGGSKFLMRRQVKTKGRSLEQCCSLKVISTLLVVILAKAGIQKLRILPRKLDSRFRGSDDKSLSEQHCAHWSGLFIARFFGFQILGFERFVLHAFRL